MSVLACVHEISDASQLDRTALALFGKIYRLLSDQEAGQVWAAIETGVKTTKGEA